MINFSTLKPNITSFNNRNNSSTPVKKRNDYPNLKALNKDTFTFTGALNRTLMEAIDNLETCTQVWKNAQDPARDFKKTLDSYLSDLVATDDRPDLPIDHITTRVKSPQSIREKVADRLEDAITENIDDVFRPTRSNEIKSKIQDIIGGRIVLRNPDHADAKKIIDRLIAAVENKQLKIIKIESYTPEGADENLAYFSQKDLQRLKRAQDKVNSPGSNKTIIKTNDKKTGYVAVHIDVDLSNPDKYVSNKDNYYGEIQVVGLDVSDLKEVEDLCYKLKGRKSLKGGNVAYKAFSEYFTKIIGDNDEARKNFEEYTKRAYMLQRKKEPIPHGAQTKRDPKFPTIEECGMKGSVPEGLDFNKLYRIKSLCDKLYEFTSGLK